VKQIYIESYYRNGYSRFMKYIYDIEHNPRYNEIEKRLEIIKFFDEFGMAATRQAFHKSRAAVFLWKHKLKLSGGKLSALTPGDKTPIHKRKRIVHPFIVDFMLKYREDHPGADKATITPALARACLSVGVKPISESTVGRIIHDLKAKGRLPKSNRITIDGRTGKLLVRERQPARKKLRRKGWRPEKPGDLIQMDTVSIFTAGIKRYIFTAVDVSTRFAFACTYKANSSSNGSDFLRKFMHVSPFAISKIQTDNGSEFEMYFDKASKKHGLVHFFNYPRHPQSNGILERFNRTVQEQYVNPHMDAIDELETFNCKLMDYLIWYNTEKPHRGIGNLSPLSYYVDNFLTPPQKSNMLWTLTIL
jgi:putative transposase